MPDPSPRPLALALLALLCVPACSGGGSSAAQAPAPPPQRTGYALDAFLPLHDGAVYDSTYGPQLRTDRATHRSFGHPGVTRVTIRNGGREFGMYVSHGSPRGSLLHGVFDRQADREVIFRTPEPLWLETPLAVEVDVYSPMHSTTPTTTGAGTIDYVWPDPTLVNRPPVHSYSTPYGRWLWRDMTTLIWRLTFDAGTGQPPLALDLYCARAWGPVQVTAGNQRFHVLELRRPGHDSDWLRWLR